MAVPLCAHTHSHKKKKKIYTRQEHWEKGVIGIFKGDTAEETAKRGGVLSLVYLVTLWRGEKRLLRMGIFVKKNKKKKKHKTK